MTMTTAIDTWSELIDSRDVIARLEELDSLADRDALEQEELVALIDLQDQAEDCCDWADGAMLVRDGYFRHYAIELAYDIVEDYATWPMNCIDWDEAARELQKDYTSVTFDGVTYWVR
jgi:hypothetical protein